MCGPLVNRNLRVTFCVTFWMCAALSAAPIAFCVSAGEPAPASSGAATDTVPRPLAEAAALKQEAVTVARQIADAYPDDALAYALLGSAYLQHRPDRGGHQVLQKCVQLNPDQAEAYGILARVAYDKGNLDECIGYSEQSLKRDPANPEVLNQMGRALMDSGRTDEAIANLRKSTQVPQAPSQSYYLLGQANLQAGRYADAKKAFQQAIALLPDHTQAFFGLFTACLKLGQTDEATQARERFLALEAADRHAHTERTAQEDTLTGLPVVRSTVARTLFGAGQLYRVHQQPAKAAELLRKAAGLDEANASYRAALEQFYLQQRAPADGIAAFEQLTSEQPKNPLNYFFLGRLRARMDQVDAAEQAYRKVQELAPNWSEGYRAMAEVNLRADRKLAESRKLAQKAVDLDPSGPNYYLLGFACAKDNDKPGAIEAIKKAVAADPGEKKYRDLLLQLERAP